MSLQEKKLIRPLPFGISEFTKVIDNNCYYSDKTLFLKKLLDTATKVILFTRPRRFGKTLNMTMLRTFFEKALDGKDTSHYFKNLAIWKAGEKYMSEQGKSPVIFLSFRGIKGTSFADSLADIKSLVSEEFKRHDYLRTSSSLIPADRKIFADVADGIASESHFRMSMLHLSKMLKLHYGQPPLILIDEYDAPIQTANDYGYYEEMIAFMRIFLSSAFKDNPYLYRGFITGITRVSKESIFSGLNNLLVDTIFDEEFSEYFGLTKSEVSDMLDYYDIPDKKEEAAHWYDGYMFGNTEIYNPWSMIQYIHSGCKAQPYWVNTSSNSLVGQALQMIDRNDQTVLENLINGGTVNKRINTNVIYPDIARRSQVAYSLLAQTGYLKNIHTKWVEGAMICTLKIPNHELKRIYFDEIIERFIQDDIAGEKAGELRQAMLEGDAAEIERLVQEYLMSAFSYFDFKEERDYHNVFLGLIFAATDIYSIKSNRESGEGRYDIAMFPKKKNLPGIIFELKHCSECEPIKSDKLKLEQLLTKYAEEALKQIENNDYLTELKEAGANPIFKYGAAFYGKKAKVVRKCE